MKLKFQAIAMLVVLVGVVIWGLNNRQKLDRNAFGVNGGAVAGLLSGENAIYLPDQPPGNEVSVAMVVFQEPGFIGIFENKGGELGQLLGISGLVTATTEPVRIELSRALNPGEQGVALLLKDDGDGEFNPALDGPVMENGQPVLMPFRVVQDAPGDVPSI